MGWLHQPWFCICRYTAVLFLAAEGKIVEFNNVEINFQDWISWDEGGSEGLEEGKGEEEEEEEGPVLSSVADLEPVYSFSSRSGYQHGRRVYSQTSYTPGEPASDYEPVYQGGPGKGSPKRLY
ncbi:hypothetical protein CRUP_003846 [Coryphaenoides rupestris]|nr:hypothetical protein CRUP_003846 [Coryphaenoides rupestris]